MVDKFPDTVAIWHEPTAADSPSANIFHSAVRVQLSWADIEDAVERGAIVASEAHALWALWACLDSPQRILTEQATELGESVESPSKPRSSLFGLFS